MKKVIKLTICSALLASVSTFSQTTLIESGGKTRWKYLDDGSEAGSTYWKVDFKDSNWKSGPAPLGHGEHGLGTSVSVGSGGKRFTTTYFRHTFKAGDLVGANRLLLFVRQDDGSAVYLNGKQVSRYNLPGGELTSKITASKELRGSRESRYRRYEIPVSSLVKGTNVIAAEVHQWKAGDRDSFFDICLRAYKEGEGVRRAKMKPEAKSAVDSYWRQHYVGKDMTIPDGYVDGGRGMKMDAEGNARSYREILTVDRTRDSALRKYLKFMRSNEVTALPPVDRAKRIGKYLLADLGKQEGVPKTSIELMIAEKANSEVLIGQLVKQCGPGVCRHESLMFKILADEADLDVALVRGNYRHRDGRTGGHAWNELILKDGKTVLVDLTRWKPGYPFLGLDEPKAQSYLNMRKQPRYQAVKPAEQN